MSQVFLCYSHKDEREAAVIRNALLQHGLNVWWDAEVPSGKEWAFELGRALEESDGMIVLVSPDALVSDLVRRELLCAISDAKFEGRLFPVIIKKPTSSVPYLFRFMRVFDITRGRKRGLKQLAEAVKKKTVRADGGATRLPAANWRRRAANTVR